MDLEVVTPRKRKLDCEISGLVESIGPDGALEIIKNVYLIEVSSRTRNSISDTFVEVFERDDGRDVVNSRVGSNRDQVVAGSQENPIGILVEGA